MYKVSSSAFGIVYSTLKNVISAQEIFAAIRLKTHLDNVLSEHLEMRKCMTLLQEYVQFNFITLINEVGGVCTCDGPNKNKVDYFD